MDPFTIVVHSEPTPGKACVAPLALREQQSCVKDLTALMGPQFEGPLKGMAKCMHTVCAIHGTVLEKGNCFQGPCKCNVVCGLCAKDPHALIVDRASVTHGPRSSIKGMSKYVCAICHDTPFDDRLEDHMVMEHDLAVDQSAQLRVSMVEAWKTALTIQSGGAGEAPASQEEVEEALAAAVEPLKALLPPPPPLLPLVPAAPIADPGDGTVHVTETEETAQGGAAALPTACATTGSAPSARKRKVTGLTAKEVAAGLTLEQKEAGMCVRDGKIRRLENRGGDGPAFGGKKTLEKEKQRLMQQPGSQLTEQEAHDEAQAIIKAAEKKRDQRAAAEHKKWEKVFGAQVEEKQKEISDLVETVSAEKRRADLAERKNQFLLQQIAKTALPIAQLQAAMDKMDEDEEE